MQITVTSIGTLLGRAEGRVLYNPLDLRPGNVLLREDRHDDGGIGYLIRASPDDPWRTLTVSEAGNVLAILSVRADGTIMPYPTGIVPVLPWSGSTLSRRRKWSLQIMRVDA